MSFLINSYTLCCIPACYTSTSLGHRYSPLKRSPLFLLSLIAQTPDYTQAPHSIRISPLPNQSRPENQASNSYTKTSKNLTRETEKRKRPKGELEAPPSKVQRRTRRNSNRNGRLLLAHHAIERAPDAVKRRAAQAREPRAVVGEVVGRDADAARIGRPVTHTSSAPHSQ